jgi:iron complex transport system substrate-binding protein
MTTRSKLTHQELTAEILRVFKHLRKEFGNQGGYTEADKSNAMRNELMRRGIAASREVPLIKRKDQANIGKGRADLVVESRVVVEVKDTNEEITEEEIGQALVYMESLGLPVGLVLNFGIPDADLSMNEAFHKVVRRVYLRKNDASKYSGTRN